MDSSERRRHKRLDLRLEVLCRKAEAEHNKMLSGQTVNVSTGGLLAHTTHSDIEVGDLLSVQLSVPPTDDLFALGGRVEGFARVIRINKAAHTHSKPDNTRLIAMQFCQRPQMSV